MRESGDGDGAAARPDKRAKHRLESLCELVLSTVRVDGTAVTTITPIGHGAVVYASDDTAAALAQLQFTLAEGPSIDAFGDRAPALCNDLSDPDAAAGHGWVIFAGAAAELGVSAVFSFPLQIGAARFGVLTLHRADRGPLNRAEVVAVLRLSDQLTLRLLDRLAALEGTHRPGHEEPGVETDEDYLQTATYQASGMIMVQLQVDIAQAMARLRALSFVRGRPINDVAGDVVAGRIVLEPDDGTPPAER